MIENILYFLLESAKLFLVLRGILGFRRKEKPIASWMVFGACILCLIIKGIQDPQYTISTFSLMVAIICALQFQEKRRILISFFSYLGICSIDELISFGIHSLFFSDSKELLEHAVPKFGINAISLVLCIIVTVFMHHRRRKRAETRLYRTDFAYVFICIVGFLEFTLLMSVVRKFDLGWSGTHSKAIISGICILGALFFVVVILLIHNFSAQKYYRDVAQVNKKLLETREQYYGVLLKKDEDTRRFRHDIKNHILCLDTLISEANYEDASEYLKQMKGIVQNIGIQAQTGNMLVNAIVNDISGKYADVMFDWNGTLPTKMQLPDTDICIIFSNILENAFCAASACGEGGKVDISVKELNGGLKILVENNMLGGVRKTEGRFLTKKKDTYNHGWGIVNVRECVKGNGGRTDFSHTDDRFFVKIVLPNAVLME